MRYCDQIITRVFLTLRAKISAGLFRRLPAIFLFCLFLFSSFLSYSQDTGISYSVSGKPLSEVLEDLSRKYMIKFAFDAGAFSRIPVTFSVKNQPVDKVLSLLTRTYSLNFRLLEGTYIVTQQTELQQAPDMNTVNQPLQLLKNR